MIPTLLHWWSVHFLPCNAVSGLGIGATTAHVSDVIHHVKDMRSAVLNMKHSITISRAWRMVYEETAMLVQFGVILNIVVSWFSLKLREGLLPITFTDGYESISAFIGV
jgi:hypothetical protein